MGERPLFSAKARGMASRADEKARMAYCSMEGIYHSNEVNEEKVVYKINCTSSAALDTAIEQLMSAAPPP